jgi:ferredoxin
MRHKAFTIATATLLLGFATYTRAEHHVPLAQVSANPHALGGGDGSLRIRVDHNACVGSAMCETFAPIVFRLNDNRQSEAVDPSGDSEEKIFEANRNRNDPGASSSPQYLNATAPSNQHRQQDDRGSVVATKASHADGSICGQVVGHPGRTFNCGVDARGDEPT